MYVDIIYLNVFLYISIYMWYMNIYVFVCISAHVFVYV